MSVTSALAGALSGLSATSRQAEILSSNVANATTPGYARRQVSLGSAVLAGHGQGVQVLGVTRDVDKQLLGERRLAQASGGDRDVRATRYAPVRLTNVGTGTRAYVIGRINNGTFTNIDPGIVRTLNGLRTVGFQGNYEYTDSADNCGWITNGPISTGRCRLPSAAARSPRWRCWRGTTTRRRRR